MVEVIATDEFVEWYRSLGDAQREQVRRYVDLLEAKGLALGFPYSSQIKGAKYAFRELRPTAGRDELRVYYAFDPRRQAVVLIGGNKSGNDRFYEEMTPKAEKIWEQYLAEQEG